MLPMIDLRILMPFCFDYNDKLASGDGLCWLLSSASSHFADVVQAMPKDVRKDGADLILDASRCLFSTADWDPQLLPASHSLPLNLMVETRHGHTWRFECDGQLLVPTERVAHVVCLVVHDYRSCRSQFSVQPPTRWHQYLTQKVPNYSNVPIIIVQLEGNWTHKEWKDFGSFIPTNTEGGHQGENSSASTSAQPFTPLDMLCWAHESGLGYLKVNVENEQAMKKSWELILRVAVASYMEEQKQESRVRSTKGARSRKR